MDQIPTPIVMMDKTYRVTFMNRAGAKLLGSDQAALIGRKCYDLFKTGHCNTPDCRCRQAMELNRIGTGETRTGSGLDIEYTGAPLTDENGNINGAVEFVLNVTAQKNAVREILDISSQAKRGNLTARTHYENAEGDFQEIAKGINEILDAIIIPLNEAMRLSDEYAKLRFSARFNGSLKVEGDFLRFSDALNHIGMEIAKAITLINNEVTELRKLAVNADSGLSDAQTGADSIAKSTIGVKDNADKGAEGVNQILKALEDLSAAVEEVTSNMESVSVMAKKANDLSTEGAKLAGKADLSMGRITSVSEIVNSSIGEINGKMTEIGKIVNLIRDIASQTNLLALNAAIEAARAGEAGRGFAVVASEVKSLAQESRESAENIATMISDLQKSAVKAGEAVDSSAKEVQNGSQDVESALRSFNAIVDSIAKMSQSTEEVAAASQEQAATVEEITASATEISKLIKGTADEASNAAAATEEAAASLSEIFRQVEHLKKISETVNDELVKFSV